MFSERIHKRLVPAGLGRGSCEGEGSCWLARHRVKALPPFWFVPVKV